LGYPEHLFGNLPEGTLAVLHHMVLETAQVHGRVNQRVAELTRKEYPETMS
jgi:hypothetical protein